MSGTDREGNVREIKFRMWNPETKVMVDLKKITPLAVHPDLLKENLDGLFIPFKENYPLMQFTGLHDKSGKEIYEGDILYHEILSNDEPAQAGKYGLRGAVEYLVNRFIVRWNDGTASLVDNLNEVIGNIWENPEFLIIEGIEN